MHKDYLDRPKDKRPAITPEYIQKTSERNFPRRQDLLEKSIITKQKEFCDIAPEDSLPLQRPVEKLKTRADLAKKTGEEMDAISDMAIDIVEGEKMINELTEEEKAIREALMNECVSELSHVLKITNSKRSGSDISKAVSNIMSRGSMIKASRDEIVKASYELLKETPTRGRKSAKGDSKNKRMENYLINKTYTQEEYNV